MTDWEKFNRQDRQRHNQLSLQLGWTFIGIAIIGGVAGALPGYADRAITLAAFNLLIGVPLRVFGLRARRKQRVESEE